MADLMQKKFLSLDILAIYIRLLVRESSIFLSGFIGRYRLAFIVAMLIFPSGIVIIPALLVNAVIRRDVISVADVCAVTLVSLIFVSSHVLFKDLTNRCVTVSHVKTLPLSSAEWFVIESVYQLITNLVGCTVIFGAIFFVVVSPEANGYRFGGVATLLTYLIFLLCVSSWAARYKVGSLTHFMLALSAGILAIYGYFWVMATALVLYRIMGALTRRVGPIISLDSPPNVHQDIGVRAGLLVDVALLAFVTTLSTVASDFVVSSLLLILVITISRSLSNIIDIFNKEGVHVTYMPRGIRMFRRVCFIAALKCLAVFLGAVTLSCFALRDWNFAFVLIMTLCLGIVLSLVKPNLLLVSQMLVGITYVVWSLSL